MQAVEFEDHDDVALFNALDGEVGGLISEEDVEYAAADLKPNSSAALLIWEDVWAAPFVEAMRNFGGVLLEGARIPHDLIEAAEAELAAAGSPDPHPSPPIHPKHQGERHVATSTSGTRYRHDGRRGRHGDQDEEPRRPTPGPPWPLTGTPSPRGIGVLAYDYPLLGLFWTMLWVFLRVAWLFILFRVVIDIFRSHDMGGWGKALWVLFVVVVPFLGVFVYLIARGRQMTEHDVEDAKNRDAAFRSWSRTTSRFHGWRTAEELSKLADLKAKGVITDAEFEQQKAKMLA